jgi:hypothetical protein
MRLSGEDPSGHGVFQHPPVVENVQVQVKRTGREQFFLTAAAQNIKRRVRFLGLPITPSPLLAVSLFVASGTYWLARQPKFCGTQAGRLLYGHPMHFVGDLRP